MDLKHLLLEIQRRERVLPQSGTDPVEQIMRRIASSPQVPENRVLLRLSAAIARNDRDFDEKDVWSLSPEGLGLLELLIDRRRM